MQLKEHKTDEMHTALMEASMDGHVEVARLLLDSGAQVYIYIFFVISMIAVFFFLPCNQNNNNNNFTCDR